MSGGGFTDIRHFDRIDSTNRYLLDEARRGAPAGVVAVADHQSAGRGRLDRRWEAPAGSCLLMSVLLRPRLAPDELHLCTGAVALAAADACWSVAGVAPTLKWPNDLLVGGKKLAGVLAEADGFGQPGGEPPAVVVGIGLNVDWPGPEGAGGTSLSADTGRTVDRVTLLHALLDAVGPRRDALDEPAGRRSLADELRDRCSTLGQRVRVELAAGSIVGTAVDLTASGHLVVATASGRQEVAAGDVVHLRPDIALN